eukprot:233758_1
METQSQVKGFKLMDKIINNILLYPNEPKYLCIDSQKLAAKLKNPDVWFRLLSLAGFESNSASQITFVSSNISQLKYVKDALKRKWNQNNDAFSCRCICNGVLTKMTVSSLYDGAGVQCDICGSITNKHSEYFWHCDPNLTHEHGYDVCGECKNNCIGNIKHCSYFNKLKQIMMDYKNDTSKNDKNITNIIDYYLHILKTHDADFDYIVSQLGSCDMVNCSMITTNIQNQQIENSDDIYDSVYTEIMNKIHCYFVHCYDIGNMLTFAEREEIFTVDKEEKDSDMLVNKRLIKMHKILKTRKNRCYLRTTTRYRQLSKLEEVKSNDDYDNLYSFGIVFEYGFAEEHNGDIFAEDKKWRTDNMVSVNPKYLSLKKELLSNSLSIITKRQFCSEYKKASIHFESRYCKTKYRPYILQRDDINKHITVQHLLSLMVYCNFDTLQYHFSKTYRTDQGQNHAEFYWLGRCLKMCTNFFGDMLMYSGSDMKFYHGISEQMSFKQCIGNELGDGIYIYGPLSTSCSFEVALNFTNDNKGMVVQFGGNWHAKYFSCSWVSDYANEKESLFIQTRKSIKMLDIIDVKNGIQYSMILNALDIINSILDINGGLLNSVGDVSDSMVGLIQNIIHHQLSCKRPSEYKSFRSLTEYGKQICNQYFEKKQAVKVDYLQCKEKYSFVLDEFGYSDTEWVKVDLIAILFPAMDFIRISDVNLCQFIVDNIASLHEQLQNPPEICIKATKHNEFTVKEAVHKLVGKQLYAMCDVDKNVLYVDTARNIKYVKKLVRGLGQKYYEDVDGDTSNWVNKLICAELSNESNTDSEEWFHKICVKQETVDIDWKSLASNPNLGIFKRFYVAEHQWINMKITFQLFPNVHNLYMKNIKISRFMMEDILIYLKKNEQTNLEYILIELSDGWKSPSDFPDYEKRVEVCKNLTGYFRDNIFENDWNDFKILYEMRDEKTKSIEDVYHVDSLITSYAVCQYQQRFKVVGFLLEDGGDTIHDQLYFRKMSDDNVVHVDKTGLGLESCSVM